MAGPTSDISASGWTAVPSGPIYQTLDEAVLDTADYATANLPVAPLVIGINPLPAGSHTVNFTASAPTGSAAIVVALLDSSGAVVGESTEMPLTSSPATWEPVITTSATASRVRFTVAEVSTASALTFDDLAVTFDDLAVSFS